MREEAECDKATVADENEEEADVEAVEVEADGRGFRRYKELTDFNVKSVWVWCWGNEDWDGGK